MRQREIYNSQAALLRILDLPSRKNRMLPIDTFDVDVNVRWHKS